MTRRAKSGGVLIFSVLLALVVSGVAIGNPAMNRDIAALYVRAADEALNADDPLQAERLIHLALEYDSSFSDAHYVLGKTGIRVQGQARAVMASLETALLLDSWDRYESTSSAVALAGVRNRIGSFSDALSVVGTISINNPLLPERLHAEALYQQAVALIGLDRRGEADDLITRARDRFPDDPRFFKLYLEGESAPRRQYRDEVERLVRRSPEPTPELLAVILTYAELAPTAEEAEWAVGEYRRLGGVHPAAAFVLTRFDEPVSPSAFLESDGITHRVEWLRLVALSDGVPDAVAQAASGFGGYSELDANRDGFWEERLTVSAGAIVRWEVDRNQDGVNEYDIAFSPDEPATVLVEYGETQIAMRYDRYPFLESVQIPREGSGELLVLRPRSIPYPVMAPLPTGGPVLLAGVALSPSMPDPDLQAIRRATIRQELLDSDGVPRELRFYENSDLRKTARDTDGDGVWDHLTVTNGGMVSAGVRDIDGDGYYEVAEGYEQGRLRVLAVDENDSGSPEMVERLEGGGIREWDLNDDGEIDVREFGIWTSAVTREFAFLGRRE